MPVAPWYTCLVTQMSKQRHRRTGGGPCCSRLGRLLSARFFKALSDPSRIAILVRLAGLGGSSTVSEVAACCPTDMSVVSRHLAVLRDAGILDSEKRGKEVCYSVRLPELVAVFRAMADGLEACGKGKRAPKRRARS